MGSIFQKIAYAGLATTLISGVAFAKMDHRDHHDDDSSLFKTVKEKVVTDNYADVDNKIDLDADTGDNDANHNHEDGTVTTGNASIKGAIATSGNEADVTVAVPSACDDCGGDYDKAMVYEKVKVITNNNADVYNRIEVKADTGDNDAHCNGDDGSVTTGSASIDLSVTNTLNSSTVSVH